MIALICFIALAVIVIVATEVRERRRSSASTPDSTPNTTRTMSDGSVCCGTHLVCEREKALRPTLDIVYFDDEELDSLAGINPLTYSAEQHQLIADVFLTLRAEDVGEWVRSLQMRNIELPLDIREEALLILQEQRNRK